MDEINKITYEKIQPNIIIFPIFGSIGNRAKSFPNGVNSSFSSIACISIFKYFILFK